MMKMKLHHLVITLNLIVVVITVFMVEQRWLNTLFLIAYKTTLNYETNSTSRTIAMGESHSTYGP
jgi:hypothetical protein